jgi:hypothetical protein
MFSRTQKPDILLQIMVDFLHAFRLVDDGKEPARPGERFRVVALKKFAVKVVDEAFHGFLGIDVVLMAPTQQRPRLARNLTFHLLFGGFRDVNVVIMAFEA